MLAQTEVILKTTVFVFLCEKVKIKMSLPNLNATMSADVDPQSPADGLWNCRCVCFIPSWRSRF